PPKPRGPLHFLAGGERTPPPTPKSSTSARRRPSYSEVSRDSRERESSIQRFQSLGACCGGNETSFIESSSCSMQKHPGRIHPEHLKPGPSALHLGLVLYVYLKVQVSPVSSHSWLSQSPLALSASLLTSSL